MEDPKQERTKYDATYKEVVPHPNKSLLLAINILLKILTSHLRDHHPHYSTALNLDPYLKYEATIKNHKFQKAKNHIYDVAPPPTPSGYHNITSSYDVRITDKMNMH